MVEIIEPQSQISQYLRSESKTAKIIEVNQKIWIPTGDNNGNYFIKKNENWITNRDKKYYDQQLFYDEFIDDENKVIRPSRLKDDNRTIEGWSREDLLGPFRVVVDLGSGQAIALLQYSKEFPQTTFIGVDDNYQNTLPLNYHHPGVQLVKDNWSKLSLFKDNSVDTFISVQGGITWSCEGPKYDRTSTPDDFLASITRVAKENCFLLADSFYYSDLGIEKPSRLKITDNGEEIVAKFKQYGWDRIVLNKSAFFILTQK